MRALDADGALMLMQLVGHTRRGEHMDEDERATARGLVRRGLVELVRDSDNGAFKACPTPLGRLALRVAVAIPAVSL